MIPILALVLSVTTPDGVRIHLLDQRPSRPTSDLALVFVPGWMMPGSIWKHQIDEFGKTMRVVAIDPRSQGDSTKTTEGNHPAQRAQDLREVIVQRGLRRVVLVAATGSVVDAVAYIEKFGTDRIAGVVFVHGVAGADYDRDGLMGLMRWAQRFQTDRAAQTESLVRSLFSKQPAPADEVRRLTAEALKMPASAAIAAFVGSLTTDMRPALPKIDKPVLIIVGESRWHEQYEAMQRSIPGSRLEKIAGAGHAPYLEAADAFNATLARFMRSLSEQ